MIEVKTALGPLTISRGRFGCCRFNGRGFGHRSPMASTFLCSRPLGDRVRRCCSGGWPG